MTSQKNEQGGEPCSKNCVDPIVPADSDFVLIGGVTLLGARQGSSRDLDHQSQPYDHSAFEFVDYLCAVVIILGNVCSKFEHFS